MNTGRDKLDWTDAIWQRIDQAVHEEAVRAEVASKFLPARGPFPDALTVPADVIDTETMTVGEGVTKPLIELWVDFSLTPQQVSNEESLSTALTLATRAANLLSRAEDFLIFQGDAATKMELFKHVHYRSGPVGTGLLKATSKVIEVTPTDAKAKKYGENSFHAVVKACSFLQELGHHGPYALALQSDLYADSFAPFAGTLVMPADRIRPLLSLGYFGTGTLPQAVGVVVSLGGNTIDVVVGADPTTAFQQIDSSGVYRFRVFERFALRIKDASAIVRLDFK